MQNEVVYWTFDHPETSRFFESEEAKARLGQPLHWMMNKSPPASDTKDFCIAVVSEAFVQLISIDPNSTGREAVLEARSGMAENLTGHPESAGAVAIAIYTAAASVSAIFLSSPIGQ